MQITEVRIKLMEDAGERLQAFCSITFDDAFVVRDLKIIEGSNGPFVAMPSRKLTMHCPQCGYKNHLRASYCNQCGSRMGQERAAKDEEGRAKLYADIAHPINSACREMIQDRVIREFQEELERAKQPGYVSRYDDYDEPEPHITLKREAPPQSAAPHVPPASIPRENVTQTQIQPAEQPRGPHTSAAPQRHSGGPHTPPASAPVQAPRTTKQDSFGAGLF